MKRTSSTSLRLVATSSSLSSLAGGAARSAAPLRTSLAGLISSSPSSASIICAGRVRLLATAAKASSSTSSSSISSTTKPPLRNADDPEVLQQRLEAFSARIGVKWNNKKLLLKAFTHPSFSHIKEESNQSLEYFGDRTLNFLVCEHLVNKYPHLPARALTHATEVFSSNAHLTTVGKRLGVQDFIRWAPHEDEDRGEEIIIANTMEALLASLYFDQGLKAAREFVAKYILPQDEDLDIIPFLRQRLPRHTLSDLLVRRGSGAPYYVVLQESARYSSKSMFVVGVYSDSQLLGQGAGQSISKAEAAAAQEALNKLWGEKAYTILPADKY